MAHNGEHKHGHADASGGNLLVAFALNLGFAAAEFAGGLWSNSVAILADALHDLGDAISLGIAWFLQKKSGQKANAAFTYGYRRFSVLGALITGLVLLAGLIAILWQTIPRLWQPQEVRAPIMLMFALIGIAVNGFAAWRLRRGSSLNERVVSWHLVEDVLGWVAVLVASVVMLFWRVPVLDPILSIGISLFVLWNVVRNLKKVLLVFLQTAPKSFDLTRFESAVTRIPNVRSSHHTHSWSIDGERHVLSTHLVMNAAASRADIAEAKASVRALLREVDFEHVTVEVELEGEACAAEADEKRHYDQSHH